MKRTRKAKAEPYVSGGGDDPKSLSKLMNKAKRLVRNLERARVKGDKDEVSSIRTELRQTEGLIKRSIETPEPKAPIQKEKKAPKAPEPKVQVARVERWVLTSEMHFGLVKAGFSKGCTFSVDRATSTMTCEDTGETYPTCKDLDIAIRLGRASPLDEDGERFAADERAKRQNRQLSSQRTQAEADAETRSKIINSDEDIIPSIALAPKKPKVQRTDVRNLEAPRDIVGLIKPRHREKMQIIQSDGPQQSIRVDSSRDHVILAKKENWDAKSMGARQSQIAKVISDKTIERNQQGQLVIRGLAVVRDDSRVGSGESLNAGTVRTFSKEELAERKAAAQAEADERKREAKRNRKNAGVTENVPQVVVGNDDEEQIMKGVSDEQLPRPAEKREKGGIGKLLKRRY